MTDTTELSPCPFCKAGETRIDEQTYWTGMRSQILSVSVKHWCPKSPLTSFIEMKAKTKEEAVALWNTRADKAVLYWQPIETAPKDGKRVLVTDGFEVCDAYFRSGEWWQYECGDDWYSVSINPTHWMPLPQPPTK